MRSNIVLLNLLILKLSLADDHLNCGDWNSYKDEKCYKFINETKLTFDEAKHACFQIEETSLVTIRSQMEQDILYDSLLNNNALIREVWLGMKYSESEYKWLDSTALNYTNWANGFPINNSGYDCVQMMFLQPYNGQWFNIPCDRENLFVCEKLQTWQSMYLQKTVMYLRDKLENAVQEIINIKQFLLTNLCDSNNWIECHIFIEKSNYKGQALAVPKNQTEKKATWDNANIVCQKYNSSLLSIESLEKQYFINETFEHIFNSCIWTSGHKMSNGIWKWTTGNVLTFTNWRADEPNNAHNNENCLQIAFVGNDKWYWNDANCNSSCFVVCEADILF